MTSSSPRPTFFQSSIESTRVGGGITRCDVVADALASAVRASGRALPMVVRFEGTNRDIARRALRDRGVEFEAADSLAQAVARVVALAGQA